MAIKPGKMGPQGNPNETPGTFADSMAADMEIMLNQLLEADGLPKLLEHDNSRETRDRRRLFVAIARGIVKHLDQQHEAIKVTVTGGAQTVSPNFEIEGKDWTP